MEELSKDWSFRELRSQTSSSLNGRTQHYSDRKIPDSCFPVLLLQRKPSGIPKGFFIC